MFRFILITNLILIAIISFSCGTRSGDGVDDVGGDMLTTHAQLLDVIDCGAYTIARVTNPWDTTSVMATYLLVPEDADVSLDELPSGIVVKVPLTSTIVYSSVHAGVIDEMGCAKAISGVVDAEYYKLPSIVSGLRSGKVIDVGSSMSPSIEQIIALNPEAILASPFQNAGHGAVEKLGIPIIECADYMEPMPLGRAEWIKLFGELYDCREVADSIFESVKRSYETIKAGVAGKVSRRPKVVTEQMIDGVWYQPGGASYMAQMLRDAGADYPWSNNSSTGSVQLDFGAVYDKAADADFWLIKTFNRDLTLIELEQNYPLNSKIKAFHNGGVYSCNTATTLFFEDFPFHPDRLLQEYVNLFSGVDSLSYYKQVR
ncbi:MAG: ABC transporter substrate-binding protein [Muribaculaceae bacterium]|nr:ABC transporter substrate-binding protein [Muribaculaceae bacterium]